MVFGIFRDGRKSRNLDPESSVVRIRKITLSYRSQSKRGQARSSLVLNLLSIFKPTLLSLMLLLLAGTATAQRTSPPTESELAQITERGKRLVEYDVAAWHVTDVVMAMQPPQGSVVRYIQGKMAELGP